nr:site-specific integrase [uncultured Holophaga sp.]
MPKFKNGLAKVGRVYHYKFSFQGVSHHGSTGCETLDAAKAWLRKFRDDLAMEAAGIAVEGRGKTAPTLRAVLDEWTTAQAGAATDRHIRNVRDAVRLHLQELLELPIDQITTRAVEDARTHYLGTTGTCRRPGQEGEWTLTHTLGGANKVVQHLRSVLGWAVRRGHLEAVPFKLPPLKPQEEIRPVVWPELVQGFLANADQGHSRKVWAFPHSATAMRLMIGLGLRENEALDARWERLDRRRMVYQAPGKNRGVREIAVPEWLLEHLDRVLGPTAALPTGLILADKDGQPHKEGFTRKNCQRSAELVGVLGLHPHRLRASFATTHFEAGTPLSQIQQMMGHEDPETTMGYIVQRPKDQHLAQAKVAELMGFVKAG